MYHTFAMYWNPIYWIIGLLLVSTGQACQEDKPKVEPDPCEKREAYPGIKLIPKESPRYRPKKNQIPPKTINNPDTEDNKTNKRLYVSSLLGGLDKIVKASNLLCVAEGAEEINKVNNKIKEKLRNILEGLLNTTKEKEKIIKLSQQIEQFCQSIDLALRSKQPERKEKIQAALAELQKGLASFCSVL